MFLGWGRAAGLSRGAVADLLCLHLLLSCTKFYLGEMETNTGPVLLYFFTLCLLTPRCGLWLCCCSRL